MIHGPGHWGPGHWGPGHWAIHPPGPLNVNGPTGLTWRHAYRLVFHPLQFLRTLADTYGDISFFRLFHKRGYFLNHPDLISQVLVHEANRFEKIPKQMEVMRQIFGEGLLVSEGTRWRRDRQHMQKLFDHELMVTNRAQTVACTERLIERWQLIERRGGTIDLEKEMTRLTAEITSSVFMAETDPSVVDRLTEAIVVLSDQFSREMNSLFRLPDWVPMQRKKKKAKSLQFYREFIDHLVARRLGKTGSRSDLIGFLAEMPQPPGAGEHYLRDQALTILIAGYHATSMAMVWILHALEMNPTIESRVRLETAGQVDGSSSLQQRLQSLSYTRQVVQETLRLYPPAWALFARQSIEPVTMRGFRIAPGGWFYISPFITHRTAQFFPNPLEFDPDRFAECRRKEIPNCAYFPFGLGGHSCIGGRMALEQLVLITATIAQNFGVRKVVPDANPGMDARLVLRPRAPMRCRLVPRPPSLQIDGQPESAPRGNRHAGTAGTAGTSWSN